MLSGKRKINSGLARRRQESDSSQVKSLFPQYLQCTAVVALVVVCYFNALHCDLVFDDVPAIEKNKDLRPWTPVANLFHNDFWGTPLTKEESHKSYRPLCVLTFRLNYLFHQLQPFGYHLLNVVLHALVCLLFYRLCLEFLPTAASCTASALFATHPLHAEAVTGVVGRAELLSSVFFLLALLYHVLPSKRNVGQDTHHFVVYFALVTMAVLSKEQGITVVGVCALYDVVLLKQPPKKSFADKAPRSKIKGPTPTWRKDLILRLLRLIIVGGLLLVFRLRIMGSRLPVFNKFDNPAVATGTPVRQLTFSYLPSFSFWLLLFPWNLCCDWSMGSIPLVSSLWDKRIVAAAIFYVSLATVTWKCWKTSFVQMRSISMGLGLLIIPYVPASNLFFPVGFVVAERVLYLPSMGFCFLVAYGYNLLLTGSKRKRTKFVISIFMFALTCLNTAKTIRRNYDWKNEETLFTSGLRVAPRNAKLWNNLGHVSQASGDHQTALKFFLKAVEIQPDDIGGYMNIGSAYNAMGKSEEAEEAFWKAKNLLPEVRPGRGYTAHIAPRHIELFSHLGDLISKNESRLEEAQEIFKEATAMKPDYTEAYLRRASILIKLNRSFEARKTYRQALQHDDTNPDVFYNIGVLLLGEGNSKQALAHFDKALRLDPQHEKSLINYAILSQDAGDAALRRTAQNRLQQLLEKGSAASERILFNMGMLAMQDKTYEKAEEYFRKAIEHRGDFTSALFNMALLLHTTDRPLEAVPYLEVLLKHDQYHLKGLMLLGNTYFSYMKNFTAAKDCYLKILSKDSEHIPALHNLCAVHVQMKELRKAESCLLGAQKLAPEEKYISDHLTLVRQRIALSSRNSPSGDLNTSSHRRSFFGSKSIANESYCPN